MNIAEAKEITGALSQTAKMPCPGYNLPAHLCKTGQRLRKVEGSACSKCYASRGRYLFKNVKAALTKRAASITNADWVEAMIVQIRTKKKIKEFRWHDSGDLQSEDHFKKIVEVCKGTPHIKHWLPTVEFKLVNKLKHLIPPNLVVRWSSPMMNIPVKTDFPISMVYTVEKEKTFTGYACPAVINHSSCDACNCRACWDDKVKIIGYRKH